MPRAGRLRVQPTQPTMSTVMQGTTHRAGGQAAALRDSQHLPIPSHNNTGLPTCYSGVPLPGNLSIAATRRPRSSTEAGTARSHHSPSSSQ
jgi:hypothetical protein